jgi:hypothetical protein
LRLSIYPTRPYLTRARGSLEREKGLRLAQKMRVGPCILAEIHLKKAEVGPTSGPTRHLSYLVPLHARRRSSASRRPAASPVGAEARCGRHLLRWAERVVPAAAASELGRGQLLLVPCARPRRNLYLRAVCTPERRAPRRQNDDARLPSDAI